MALDTFLLYLATWTLVALSPGPAVMFAMSQAARHGMRGAAAGTAGILLGHVIVFGAVDGDVLDAFAERSIGEDVGRVGVGEHERAVGGSGAQAFDETRGPGPGGSHDEERRHSRVGHELPFAERRWSIASR